MAALPSIAAKMHPSNIKDRTNTQSTTAPISRWKMHTMIIVQIALLLCGMLSAVKATLVVHETMDTVRALQTYTIDTAPDMWIVDGPASPNAPLQFVIALQVNGTKINQVLEAVSDPNSPMYGKFLTMKEAQAISLPDPNAISAVTHWLHDNGVQNMRHTESFDLIAFEMKSSQAEKLLNARYNVYRHAMALQQVSVIRTQSYSIPVEIARSISFIGPTIRFPAYSMLKHTVQSKRLLHQDALIRPPCYDNTITPACLRILYDIPNQTVNSSAMFAGSELLNAIGVSSFLEQFVNISDVQQFYETLVPTDFGLNIVQLEGLNNASHPGSEATLDVDYGSSLVPGMKLYDFYTPGRDELSTFPPGMANTNEPWATFLFHISTTANLPAVISMSYGDSEPTVQIAYAQRVAIEFAKAATRGITFVASSGDAGTAGSQQPRECHEFIGTFPASVPYGLTACGGTTIESCAAKQPCEIAWPFSGGGLSNIFDRPSYQDSMWESYLKSGVQLPPFDLWNMKGRVFPDVASVATNFVIILSGKPTLVDGTSAAAPTFAGIIALLNDQRASRGQGPIGWLNPLLYSHPHALNHITSGGNKQCNGQGFEVSTAAHFSPVTGLGTPNYSALNALFARV